MTVQQIGVKGLKVYQMAFEAAGRVFEISRAFPKEELYSLTDQLRRSSRSVAANIREGYAKKKYESVRIRHLNDALGSSEETRTWLDFSRQHGYMDANEYRSLDGQYDQINAMIFTLINRQDDFSKN